jgi:hypothetical protein
LDKLLAVTVCVNYSDILEYCIHANKKELKNWWIITSPSDIKTIELCRKYGVSFFITDSFYKNNSLFNKAAALNDFFEFIKNEIKDESTEWILMLDADIIIYDLNFNSILSVENSTTKLFTCKRKIYNSKKDYESNIGYIDSHYVSFVGYFHLFHKNNILNDLLNNKKLFVEYPTASEYDNVFRDTYWRDFNKKILMPGLLHHLGPKEVNWSGRTELSWNSI